MMLTLQNLSIRKRVAGGFALVLVLCALLALASIQGMRVVTGSVASSRSTAITALAAEEFASRLAELNNAVLRYALSGTGSDRNEATRSLASTAEAFEKLSHESGNTTAEEIRVAFDQYRAATDDTFKAVGGRFSSAEELKRNGIEFNNLASAIVSRLARRERVDALPIGTQLQKSLQASLVAATRYLASLNPADADTAKTRLDVMQNDIDMSGLAAAARGDARLERFSQAVPELVKKYAGAIDKLLQSTDLAHQGEQTAPGRGGKARDGRGQTQRDATGDADRGGFLFERHAAARRRHQYRRLPDRHDVRRRDRVPAVAQHRPPDRRDHRHHEGAGFRQSFRSRAAGGKARRDRRHGARLKVFKGEIAAARCCSGARPNRRAARRRGRRRSRCCGLAAAFEARRERGGDQQRLAHGDDRAHASSIDGEKPTIRRARPRSPPNRPPRTCAASRSLATEELGVLIIEISDQAARRTAWSSAQPSAQNADQYVGQPLAATPSTSTT